jgi:hypothetical protein
LSRVADARATSFGTENHGYRAAMHAPNGQAAKFFKIKNISDALTIGFHCKQFMDFYI